eukprot:TRINITY_DN64117_c0_g1_i1.p1 TRINITY_DN64117_c0_g1~~TRINITY_DN64117_c0_g1_i1.p1  ORF type:complete len:380 (+),score=68.83 TRINITY_DN64117_c0_g1_i1:85-1224(+)
MATPVQDVIFEQCVEALPPLTGKCFAVTGTTSGTGYHACIAAIRKGASALFLLNRPSSRAAAAEAKLKDAVKASGSATIIKAVDCDLQSFDSVCEAATSVQEAAVKFNGLDGLINNAGIMGVPDRRTQDGFDVQMQTNHLSHFLLTSLLLPSLEAAVTARGEARVVQHSSGARGKLMVDDEVGNLRSEFFCMATPGALGGDEMAACLNRYHQTKLANSVFAMELHDRLQAALSKIKSVCAEPGVSQTDLATSLAKSHAEVGSSKAGVFAAPSQARFPGIQSAADGACSLMEAAFGRETNSGDFFMPGSIVKKTVVGMPVKCMTGGCPTPSTSFIKRAFEDEKLTMDPANRELLWLWSLRAIGKWNVAPFRGLEVPQSKL